MPGQESLGFIVVAVVMVAIIAYRIVRSVRGKRDRTRSWEKQEALFQATFPELQPYFHPRSVLEFVNAWRARPMNPGAFEWKNPPGLGVGRARFSAAGEKGQPVELLDSAGTAVSRFILQDHDQGGVIRIGPGKLTANVRDAAVRYWHPEREFKWSRAKGWRLITQLADRPIDSTDRGTTFSSSSDSPSVTTTAAAAAATGAVLGAGGAFDGGGASEGWSDSSSGEGRTSY
jgi:hypothetical protein